MLRLSGIVTATPTPLLETGRIDRKAVAALAESMIAAGTAGLAPIGGTGEATALSVAQRQEMLEATLDAAAGRVPVIAGILSPGIGDTLEAARAYEAAGADMLMVVTPYYARPTQAGIVDYYKAVSDASSLPQMLYEIPYRTGIDLAPETVAALAAETRVTAMKACSPSLPQQMKVVELAGAQIDILTGEENVYPVHVAMGAKGGVLATSCLFPRAWALLHRLAASGRMAEATVLHRRLMPAVAALYAEHNPGPLRAALEILGQPQGAPLPPLRSAGPDTVARLRDVLPAALQIEAECSAALATGEAA
ncbi:4-hydroxy-tetrahydrodipicolinate synthase [Mangrovicoccus sp. HB161399]|uniref:4-hydroxy-tetrahydrodipicolinate synthase n=1 Tax=Mangrovicoccus sp. HB161399 TaxID=2720392 RepID=UPI00155457CC|nr:4-hydroxy-tetrahydrodipicolinate synthase [Mangrovicoccus sp. HB161399]